ncbi:hypothetical protein [Amycolatopsis sp.]|uniref:phage scaffolding protein n=1 Tax=Amycolatopsis sp. TaxID=37632 RepID=UPI002B490768|nr:hypothetical protein [Amycolatopsis sp.]
MKSTVLPVHAVTGIQAVGWRKARRGEVGDQPIWPILGGADDGDDSGDGDDADTGQDEGDAQKMLADAVDDGDKEQEPEGADKLGDAGKKALDAMKAKRNEYRDQLRAAKAELEQLRNGAKKDDEPTADEIRQQAEREAATKANTRIVRSEIRAAAAGKLADPKDALSFLDVSKFEVDEDGEVDADEIAEAIDELLKNKPYLGVAQGKQRFQGGADAGAKPAKPARPNSLHDAVTRVLTKNP